MSSLSNDTKLFEEEEEEEVVVVVLDGGNNDIIEYDLNTSRDTSNNIVNNEDRASSNDFVN